MNEQIRELAEQAIANVRFWNAKKESYDVGHDELEKFAELIVKECISKLDGIGVIDRDSRTIAMKVVSEHFGVEE